MALKIEPKGPGHVVCGQIDRYITSTPEGASGFPQNQFPHTEVVNAFGCNPHRRYEVCSIYNGSCLENSGHLCFFICVTVSLSVLCQFVQI